jgi:DegV family protein with EDD domain
MAVKVVTDSTSDVPDALAKELDITIVPENVHFGDTVYRDRIDLTDAQFFDLLATSKQAPKTSQPSVGAFSEVYEPLSRQAEGILSVHISSKLSGTCNSADLAAAEVRDRCPVEIVDSLSSSLGLGLIAIAAARAAREGIALAEIAALARALIPKIHVVFFVETLEYLQRGGRIGRAQAFLGSLLNVKPVLIVRDGEIHPFERVRTRRKALDRLRDYVLDVPEVAELGIMHSTSPDDVETLINALSVKVPAETVIIGRYGAVLGTHLGPGGVGVIVREP